MPENVREFKSPEATPQIQIDFSPHREPFAYSAGSVVYSPAGVYFAHAKETITFTATVDLANPATQHIIGYEWDFGDGSKGYGNPVTHIYNLDNENTQVRLTVTDNKNRKWIATKAMYLRHSAYMNTLLATSGIVGLWRLGEATGTTALDSTGNTNGTYVGGPDLAQVGALYADYDLAVYFGIEQYVEVPDTAKLDVGDKFSIEAWVKIDPDGVGTERGIVAKGTGGYYLRLETNNGLALLTQNEHYVGYSDFAVPNDNIYHHCVVTKDGADIHFYIDGKERTGSLTNFTVVNTADPLFIGAGGDGEDNGQMYLDEVALYNRPLTATEVNKHYLIGKNPLAQSLFISEGFETGDLVGWNIAGVGDVVPVVSTEQAREGTQSAKFTLTGTQDRSELILGGEGDADNANTVIVEPGDTRTYSFSIYVDEMIYGKPGAHNLFFQLKGNDEGEDAGPHLSLHLWDYEGDDEEYKDNPKGLWVQDVHPGTETEKNFWVALLPEKQWHDIEIKFKVSNDNEGSYGVKLNGIQVAAGKDLSTIAPTATLAYLKNGLYRNGTNIPGKSVLYFDNVKLIG